MRELAWRQVKIKGLTKDGEWQDLQIDHLNAQGEWITSQMHTAERVWPQRSTMPAPAQVERKGRDVLYDQHVADKTLMMPLRAARTYLVDEHV